MTAEWPQSLAELTPKTQEHAQIEELVVAQVESDNASLAAQFSFVLPFSAQMCDHGIFSC